MTTTTPSTPPHAAPRPRILIVEDDPDTARLMARFLSRDYEVAIADDGVHGLAAARESAPDVILADVMLPGLNGLAMSHMLRSDPGPKAAVIFVTACARPSDVIAGIQAGGFHYLTKPFQLETLADKVRRALGRTSR